MKFRFVMALAVALFLLQAINAVASSGVMIAPVRVDIGPNEKYGSVTVINQSQTEPIAFTLSTVTLRMDETGKMIEPEAASATEKVAREIVKFSPKEAIIPPGKSQVVRILVRRDPGLPEGEYMTYLAATPKLLEPIKPAPTVPGQGVNSQITLLFGVRVPIVIQHGRTSAEVIPASVKVVTLPSGEQALETAIQRTGNASSMVDVEVRHVDAAGTETVVGIQRRLIIYKPLQERTVQIPLVTPLPSGGRFRLVGYDLQQPDRTVVFDKTF